MAIFQYWNAGHFQNPVSISRQELMRISKISAKATYHKCIKDLHSYGYIQYEPSFNPFKGSLVYLFDFQTSTKQAPIQNRANIETSIEQALDPYINKENNSNKNIENKTSPINDIVVKVTKTKAKVIEANGKTVSPSKPQLEKERTIKSAAAIPPDIKNVLAYFAELASTDNEANKFFNYFQSNGWKVGGKTPMQDWQAAARNWLINASHFSQNRLPPKSEQPALGKLDTTTRKNYAEPL